MTAPSSPSSRRSLRGPRLLQTRGLLRRLFALPVLVPMLAAPALPSAARAQGLSTDMLERAKKATVFVWTFRSERERADTPVGTGSGYFINSTGLLVTNNHVVDPAHGQPASERLKMQASMGKLVHKIIVESGTDAERVFECDVIHQSESADQAFLQARTKDGSLLKTQAFLRLGPEWSLEKGVNAIALGFPGGNRQSESRGRNAAVTVTEGSITDVPRAPSGRVRRIGTNVIARPGNSGGPMIDNEGQVIGTVTLLTVADEEANSSALVPTTLTRSLLRHVFRAGLLPEGSDIAPIASVLADESGGLVIPSFDRIDGKDTIVVAGDDRVYGTIGLDEFVWKSPLAAVTVRAESAAYILSSAGRSTLVLEGGDSLVSNTDHWNLPFSGEGGASPSAPLPECTAVVFRTPKPAHFRPSGEVFVLSSAAGRLTLADASGEFTFQSGGGSTRVKFGDIRRIEPGEGADSAVVRLADGRVLKGSFSGDPIEATLAMTGHPVKVGLSGTTDARIDRLRTGAVLFGGADLLSVLSETDDDLWAIAELIDAGKLDDARKQLEPYLDRRKLAKMPDTTKFEVRLLDGMIALRAGEADAHRKLRKCNAAPDAKISAFSRGCVSVLREYGLEVDGQPLSDPQVFRRVGRAHAEELITEAQRLLRDRENLSGKRGEYNRYILQIQKYEKAMQAASVFAGPEADDVLIDLWRFAIELAAHEWIRIYQEYQELLGGRSRVPLPVHAKLTKLVERSKKIDASFVEYYLRQREYGFYAKPLDLPKLPEN